MRERKNVRSTGNTAEDGIMQYEFVEFEVIVEELSRLKSRSHNFVPEKLKYTMKIPSATRKFSCPLTNTIMEDPVIVPCCASNFERKALLSWMRQNGNRCPQSGAALLPSDLKPNAKLQWEILYLERKNSDMDRSERSSTSVSPMSNADFPPINPRSPPESIASIQQTNNVIGQSSRKDITVASTLWTQRSMGLPPSQCSRSASETNSFPPSMKRVDSAPTLPKRTDAFASTTLNRCLLFSPHSPECFQVNLDASLSSMSSYSSAETRLKLLNVLDEALALLESDQ